MKVLVTGSEGYVGRALIRALSENGIDYVAVDSLARHTWEERVLGKPLSRPTNNTIFLDVSDPAQVNEVLAIHRPTHVIHLASQPSMPYSQINSERAKYTQLNNLLMNLNLLWGLKENDLINTRYIITTTTGIPGQIYKSVPEDITKNAAGSWYHISRGFDSANCNLASRQFNIQVVEFRTSIVWGMQADVPASDPYFGTVLHRFIEQALSGHPITVYGKGDQTKPFVHLNDVIISLLHALKARFSARHTILNQVSETISIRRLADMVGKCVNCRVITVPNPRKENETHKMSFRNEEFLKLLRFKPKLIKHGLRELVEQMESYQEMVTYET